MYLCITTLLIHVYIFWLISFDGDTWRCISIIIFCVKFAFEKKDVFLCEKDKR